MLPCPWQATQKSTRGAAGLSFLDEADTINQYAATGILYTSAGYYGRLVTDIDLKIAPGQGGIRASLPRPDDGAVTFGALPHVLPFGNRLVHVDLTGKQPKRLLEQQWEAARATCWCLPKCWT